MSELVEVASPRPRWGASLREIWERRDLLVLLLRKDLLASYKQSLLGPLWFVIQPLVTSLVFGLLFGRFARLSPPSVPPFLYYLAGYVLWNYFSSSLTLVSGSLVANVSILRKIYFPRLIIPLVAAGVSTVHFLINYLVFLAICGGYALGGWSSPITLRGALILVPAILVFVGVIGAGIGTWMAAWSVSYRDLRIGLPVVVNLWMFATPIIWPLKLAPPDKRWLFAFNPMAPVVEAHRAALLGTVFPDPWWLLIGGAVGLAAVIGGLVVYHRAQATMVDTL